MTQSLHDELKKRSLAEPVAKLLGMEVVEIGVGTARVAMRVTPELENIFGSTHGGAVFSLLDEAFQLACNSHGILSVALNVNITYLAPPAAGSVLEAQATEVNKTNRTSLYACEVREKEGKLIATAQALAYRTGREIPFPGA